MIIPPINNKGVFKFKPPFDTVVDDGLELRVIAIRSIEELISSDINPYDMIYKNNNITEEEYNQDVTDRVPIVVMVTEGDDYLYVPANRILTTPQIIGIKYREKILAIQLGAIPLDTNLELIKNTIQESVYDILGIESRVEEVDASAITLIEKDKHDEYMKLLKNRRTIDKSYKTMYVELSRIHNDQQKVIKLLESKAVELRGSSVSKSPIEDILDSKLNSVKGTKKDSTT